MAWALLIQAVILGFGMLGAWRERSAAAAAALALSPLAIIAAAAALRGLSLDGGILASATLLAASASVSAWQTRRHFALADLQSDRSKREGLESLAGSLLANATYSAVLTVLTVVLAWLMAE